MPSRPAIHLLELDPYRGIRILAPAAVLEFVNSREGGTHARSRRRRIADVGRDSDDRSPGERPRRRLAGWRMPWRYWRNWTTRSWRMAFRESGRPSGRRLSASSSAWRDTRGRPRSIPLGMLSSPSSSSRRISGFRRRPPGQSRPRENATPTLAAQSARPLRRFVGPSRRFGHGSVGGPRGPRAATRRRRTPHGGRRNRLLRATVTEAVARIAVPRAWRIHDDDHRRIAGRLGGGGAEPRAARGRGGRGDDSGGALPAGGQGAPGSRRQAGRGGIPPHDDGGDSG